MKITLKKPDKRQLLLLLPLLILPFLALAFFGLKIGSSATEPQNPATGLNASLPDAAITADQPQGKLGIYEKSGKDTLPANDIEGVAGRLGFQPKPQDEQAKAITTRLAELEHNLHTPDPETPKQQPPVSPPAAHTQEVERLEKLMQAMQEDKKPDPEMAQLSTMLDKIIQIQHPAAPADTAIKPAGPDSAFHAIPAVIDGNQKVAPGGLVKLKLLDMVTLKGLHLPKGQQLFGSCTIVNQRLLLTITNVRLGSSIIPVDLTVFSLDGIMGIDAPEADFGEAGTNAGSNAIQSMQFLPMDQSLGVQAAGAGIDAAKSLIGRKARKVRVKLHDRQQVLLRINNK